MATRFVRIDLSDDARDFRPIAVEPGLPLLDRSSANAKILYRWLGGLAAEPVWEGEAVSFFVRDDHGGRLEDVVCQPATREDLETILKDDLAALKGRLEKARPETPTERTLWHAAIRALSDLTDDPHRGVRVDPRLGAARDDRAGADDHARAPTSARFTSAAPSRRESSTTASGSSDFHSPRS